MPVQSFKPIYKSICLFKANWDHNHLNVKRELYSCNTPSVAFPFLYSHLITWIKHHPGFLSVSHSPISSQSSNSMLPVYFKVIHVALSPLRYFQFRRLSTFTCIVLAASTGLLASWLLPFTPFLILLNNLSKMLYLYITLLMVPFCPQD